jgi:cell division septal protein FtsQ
MISSNENLGDRPVRKNINKIAFVLLAFSALVILLAVWYFATQKPPVSSIHKDPNRQHTQTQ